MSTSAPFVPDSSIHIRDMVKYPRTPDRLRAWRAYPYREGRTLPDMWFGCECPATPRPKDDKRPDATSRLYHYGGGIGCDIDALRPFRFVGFADEVGPIDHTGWFGDDEGTGFHTCRGVVYQIPARNGEPVYLAGYEWGESAHGKRFASGGGSIEYGGRGDTYESKEEAARAADSLAEYAAEREREYQREEAERLREEEEEAERKREEEEAALEAEEEAARESLVEAAREVGEEAERTVTVRPAPLSRAIDRLADALDRYERARKPAPATSADSE